MYLFEVDKFKNSTSPLDLYRKKRKFCLFHIVDFIQIYIHTCK